MIAEKSFAITKTAIPIAISASQVPRPTGWSLPSTGAHPAADAGGCPDLRLGTYGYAEPAGCAVGIAIDTRPAEMIQSHAIRAEHRAARRRSFHPMGRGNATHPLSAPLPFAALVAA